MKTFYYTFVILAIFAPSASAAIVVNFEELTTFTGTGPTGSFYNGNDGSNVTNSNGWSSQGVTFNNNYDSRFGGFWSGWSYSNVVNTTTPGFGNQYASFPGGGSDGIGGVSPGGQYAVAFGSGAFFNLPTGFLLSSVDLSNTTYTALSMQNGDRFAKQFGGTSGNDPDFFRATLTGFDSLGGTGNSIGSVTANMADFTFPNNSQDFILGGWTNFDLSSIGTARSVRLTFASSDVGNFGINTPTYLALDNLTLTAVPEPSSLVLLGLAGAAIAWRRSNRQHTSPDLKMEAHS